MSSHQRLRNDPQELVDRSSLNNIELVSPRAYNQLPEDNIASSIPLPASIDESSDADPLTMSQSLAESQSSIPLSEKTDAYAKLVQSLHQHLPHLQNVLHQGRGKPVRIDCFEYTERKLLSHKTFRSAQSTKLLSKDNESLSDYLENVPSYPVQLQLLVATDMSIPLMNYLGSSLEISPEMFEEHLLNSGWRDGRYDDFESNTWTTRNMTKDYTSLKWYRPVKRILPNEYDRNREKLLNDKAGVIERTEDDRNAAGKSTKNFFKVYPSTNILRREWDLRTDLRGTSSAGTSSVWEERATIWTRQYETCRTVVLLLDPLPTLQVRRGDKRKMSAAIRRKHDHLHWARKFIARLRRERPLTEIRVGDPEQPNILEVRDGAESVSAEVLNPPIYKESFSRGPMIKYKSVMSPEYTKKLVAHMSGTKSTAGDLFDYLNSDEARPQEDNAARNPLDCLFAIIHSDTLNLLHVMELALSKIGRHMLNDTSIQHRLVRWRNLLEDFDTELNGLDSSLQGFVTFLDGFHHGSQDFSALKDRIMQCATNITRLQQRTERTNKSLMANMSILESKRGIAQAESVTKITELAFVFIPLTFSASIFSMQVKELSKKEVSLRSFFIVAIVVTTSSYALRLIIRSTWVARRRQTLLKRITEDGKLQPGDPIPTRIFLAWFWGRLGFTGRLILAIAIMSALPLSLIWTSPLVGGIKVAITILTSVILLIPLILRIFQAQFLKKREKALANSTTVEEHFRGDSQRASIILDRLLGVENS